MDLTEALPMGAPGGGWAEEVKEWLQDEGLLSYLDQLCSQEDFVTQVGLACSSRPTRSQRVALLPPDPGSPRLMGLARLLAPELGA